MKERKKKWQDKVELVRNSFLRSSKDKRFAHQFYQSLFFLNPSLEKYFVDTDFEHQRKAFMNGLGFLIGFLDESDSFSRTQVVRIAKSHSYKNLNINPHHYYYWIDAIIMTVRKLDPQWHEDLAYYWREVINMPVSFIISQYYKGDDEN